MLLKAEREKLTTDLTNIEQTVDEQEKTLTQDLNSVHKEIEKLKPELTEIENQNPKQSTTNKTQEQ